MEKLDVIQMEDVQGGDGVLCGVGIGLTVWCVYTGIGAVIGLCIAAVGCLTGDTE